MALAEPGRSAVNSPYGGRVVDLLVDPQEREEWTARAATLPSIQISDRSLCDLELLAVGAFSPLEGFMGGADYEHVLEEMRLTSGTLWPIPITLPVPDDAPLALDAEVALRSARNELMAVLTVEEAFAWDPEKESRQVLGRFDVRHPLSAEMTRWGKRNVSGRLRVLRLPTYHDFRELRLSPREVRARLSAMGLSAVVAFQTRNPLHRSHEELTKRAAASCGGGLLVHPAVGLTKPGDVDHYTRVRTYKALVEKYYDRKRTMLSLLPLAMRLAGPREALWHAIIRRNYGATHFIVGRDHAGPGKDSAGRPFFGPYDAQELVAAHAEEIGVRMVPFKEMVFLPDEQRYEESDRVPAGARTLAISGTQVRDEYLARGRALPEWFTRPETAAILAEMAPARHLQGFCVWFTGLSGAGKSATADVLTSLLLERGRRVTVLDGDVIRTHLSKGLGFSREDRDANILRVGFVASEIVRHGGAVICAAISPYRATRNQCRALVGPDRFLEIFVDTPLAVCESRDTKGLYAKARRGELKGFTGIDDPYEPPEAPELVLSTEDTSAEDNARRVARELEARGFVPGP
ncbi:MAG TPA: bifunctional sulfate adenylyltransferase/adenylylsulfate kinase [Vicinamibacteria bacterium]|jgi:sulfate adenylyltransferase